MQLQVKLDARLIGTRAEVAKTSVVTTNEGAREHFKVDIRSPG
jgi:hypothetical protein